MNVLETVLSGISLFSKLPETSIKQLAHHTYTHIYDKDTIITREGDVSDVLYIILSGSVKVFLENPLGECMTLRELHRGDYFGELSLLDESSRSASVVTLEKTMLGILEKEAFLSCLRKNPEIAISLCTELSRRMRTITENVKDLNFQNNSGGQIIQGKFRLSHPYYTIKTRPENTYQ